MQSELESLSRTAISEKEEAGVVIVGLMDTFEIAREEQSRILDEKELELEVRQLRIWVDNHLSLLFLLKICRDLWQDWIGPLN